MMGKLYAVGFGPGGYEHMTAKAIDVIKKCRCDYRIYYICRDAEKVFPDKEYVANSDDKGDGSLPYGS